MAPPRNDMVEMATARANVYGLLADIFREEPSETLLSKLGAEEFSTALNALNLSLDEMFESTSRVQLVEDLALEFTRLFIGPGSHLSPHESMHVEPRFGEQNSFWSEQTVEVKKFIEATGLEIDESFTGMPDHISAELEFMQRLTAKEAEAWKEPDEAFAANIMKIEKRFLDEHLSQWAPRFCNRVIAQAEHSFYRCFADVMEGFLDFECENLDAFIAQAETGGAHLADAGRDASDAARVEV